MTFIKALAQSGLDFEEQSFLNAMKQEIEQNKARYILPDGFSEDLPCISNSRSIFDYGVLHLLCKITCYACGLQIKLKIASSQLPEDDPDSDEIKPTLCEAQSEEKLRKIDLMVYKQDDKYILPEMTLRHKSEVTKL